MAQVQLNNIGKTYPNGFEALHPTTFEIAEGEFCVLVGPSGCGKSTLLRMVAGLEDITAGELQIAGRVVNHIDPADRDIAMVFQNYALFPHMTIAENLSFPLEVRKIGKSDREAKVKRARVSLNQQIGRMIKKSVGAKSKRNPQGQIARGQASDAFVATYTLLEKPAAA